MDSFEGRRVLVFQQREWGQRIGHRIARDLQDKGCRLAAITIKQATHDFVLQQDEVQYDFLQFSDPIKEDPCGFLKGDNYSLDEICDALGIISIWEIVQSMRLHVKSYGDKYYYGFRQNMSDEAIIDYVKATYKLIRVVFDEFDPEAVVTPNFVALQHIMFNLFCRKRGVEMIALCDSKVSGLYYFSTSYLEDTGPFNDRFAAVSAGEKSPNEGRAIEYIRSFRENFVMPADMIGMADPAKSKDPFMVKLKKEIVPFYQCFLYFKNKGWERKSPFGPTLDNLSPYYILRDHYARKKNLWASMSYPYVELDSVKKFAFFPMQFQPEQTLDVQSPRFNNQLETARQVAMSLPGDMVLVVKDHPHMRNLRPASYLDKMARTPNVKLIHPGISSEKVLKKAALVVAPGGTILAEAAMLNLPAIQLGELGNTLCLPNVHKHTDVTTLAEKIEEVLSLDMHGSEYEQGLINYVAAMYDVGVLADYASIWEQGKKEGLDLMLKEYLDCTLNALRRRSAEHAATS